MKRKVRVGDLYIGGDAPISIQSMTNTDTRDWKSTVEQIARLTDAGCDIVRVAVPDMEAAEQIANIKKNIKIPLVVDIHFDYRLALKSMENGADKVRINPGNIGSMDNVKKVVDMAKERQIPIRIGVNGGSLDKELLKKYGGVTADALVESALSHVQILDELNFNDTIVSIKVSSVPLTLDAYRKFDRLNDIPLHIGVTEAGVSSVGMTKSACCLGALLAEGIGNTMRVSLTDDPVNEVYAAKQILKAMEIRNGGINLISCPTCGRTEVNLIELASKAEKLLSGLDKNLTVAIMGCAVNGPGEAREADIGLAGGKNEFILFKKGQILRKIDEDKALDALMEEIEKL